MAIRRHRAAHTDMRAHSSTQTAVPRITHEKHKERKQKGAPYLGVVECGGGWHASGDDDELGGAGGGPLGVGDSSVLFLIRFQVQVRHHEVRQYIQLSVSFPLIWTSLGWNDYEPDRHAQPSLVGMAL